MNYLETGLPHTDFCRRKTDFSPPRYIPLCGGLGRKYLGLEPLSRREVAGLIRRLSEPKKSTEDEEQIPVLMQSRRRTPPGSGRFVGQKRMSSFEIEKMVDRLYSRRSTKDYAFVEESVEAADIINMTDQLDELSDSEDEREDTKMVKNRENCLLRRQNSARVSSELERKRSPSFKRDSLSPSIYEPQKSGKSRVLTQNKTPAESSWLKLDNKPRRSVSFQRPKSLIENRRQFNEFQLNLDKHVIKSCECSNPSKQENSRSPFPQGPRRCKSEVVTLEKINDIKTGNSFQNIVYGPVSYAAELTRPSPSKFEIPRLVDLDDKRSGTEFDQSSAKCDISNEESGKERSEQRGATKYDSPRQKPSKTEETKSVRYAAAPCDELLIDRVATYNRSPRLRCK